MCGRCLCLLITLLGAAVSTNRCPGIKRDLVILLDSSTSVGQDNFEKAKEFLAELINEFEVGDSGYQVAVVRFSDSLRSIASLGRYNDDKDSLTEKVRNIVYNGGGTATGEALKIALTSVLRRKNREDAPDQILILTDGMSDKPEETKLQTEAARAQNVELISIGVGPAINQEELLSLASNKDMMYEVNSFDDLNSIKSDLVASSCGVKTTTSATTTTTTTTTTTPTTTTPTTTTPTTTSTIPSSSTIEAQSTTYEITTAVKETGGTTSDKIATENVADVNMAKSDSMAVDSQNESMLSSAARKWRKIAGLTVGLFVLVGLATGLVILIVKKINMKKKKRFVETL